MFGVCGAAAWRELEALAAKRVVSRAVRNGIGFVGFQKLVSTGAVLSIKVIARGACVVFSEI